MNPPPPEVLKTRLGGYLSGLPTGNCSGEEKKTAATPRSLLHLKCYRFTENLHGTTLFLLVATFAPLI